MIVVDAIQFEYPTGKTRVRVWFHPVDEKDDWLLGRHRIKEFPAGTSPTEIMKPENFNDFMSWPWTSADIEAKKMQTRRL